MSKRAEQRGLEALPPKWRKTKDGKGKIDSALPVRKFYIRAYEQAEKDTLDRVCKWLEENATYTHPRKGIKTCIINLNALREAMEEEGFINGYEQAEINLGWRSVEESLPKVGEEVIVLIDALDFHLFYRLAFGHIVNEGETVDIDGKPYKPESHNGWNIPGVKFWMPMPKMPEE